jgi:hypothetical protein
MAFIAAFRCDLQAVFASALAHTPLEFPLKVRTHPFDA